MRDDELDRIIDTGLNTYAEPPAGIEGRVLSQVSESRPMAPLIPIRTNAQRLSSRAAWQVWAVGLSMAACVLIAVMVRVRVVEAPQMHNEQAVNRTHAPVMDRAAEPEARTKAPVRAVAKHRVRRIQEARLRRLPKKDLFPTPRPLSPEIQTLAQFVARAPEAQRKQLIDAQAKLDAPITIAPLQIAPLKESDEDEH